MCDFHKSVWFHWRDDMPFTCLVYFIQPLDNRHASCRHRPFSPGRSCACWTQAVVLLSLGTSDKTAKSQAEHLVPLSAPSAKFPVRFQAHPAPTPCSLRSDSAGHFIEWGSEFLQKGDSFQREFFETRNHCQTQRGWSFRHVCFDLSSPFFKASPQTLNTFYDVLHGPAPHGNTFSWSFRMFSSHSRSCFLHFIALYLTIFWNEMLEWFEAH